MNWKKDNNCSWFKNKSCCDKTQHQEVSLRQEVENFFGNLFDKCNKNAPSHFDSFQPKVNISENRNQFNITVDLPGVNKRDIKLSIHNGYLTISGESCNINEETSDSFHKIERSFGTFRRQLALPDNIQENNIATKFNNGVLSIVIPKKEPGNPGAERFIDIEE